MNRFNKWIAIGSAVAAGPLLATTAVSIRHAAEAEQAKEEDGFSLDSAFVQSPSPAPTNSYCWEYPDGSGGGCVVDGGGGGGGVPWWWSPGGGGDGGGGSGGCNSDDPNHCDDPSANMPVADATPCVRSAPSNYDLARINDIAKAAGVEIERLNYSIEWGVIIYYINGEYHSTAIMRGDDGRIDWSKVMPLVPNNAVIVANLHHHPDLDGINDAIPSYQDLMHDMDGQDWLAYDSFLNFHGRGITVDPNLLMYIHTNEPGKQGTWVYDRTNRNTRYSSCRL